MADWSKVNPDRVRAQIARHTEEVGDCLEWTGRMPQNVPKIQITIEKGKSMVVSARVASLWLSGVQIRPKYLVYPHCRNLRCVAPEHMRQITKAQHVRIAAAGCKSLSFRVTSAISYSKRAKYPDSLVQEIRMSDKSNMDLAKEYGIPRETICRWRMGHRRTLLAGAMSGIAAQLMGAA